MKTAILCLDRIPKLVLVNDKKLLFIIELTEKDLISAVYNALRPYTVDELKIICKPIVTTQVNNELIDELFKIRSLIVGKTTNFLFVADDDCMMLNELGTKLRISKIEMYDYLSYYIACSYDKFIMVDHWNGNYMCAVIEENVPIAIHKVIEGRLSDTVMMCGDNYPDFAITIAPKFYSNEYIEYALENTLKLEDVDRGILNIVAYTLIEDGVSLVSSNETLSLSDIVEDVDDEEYTDDSEEENGGYDLEDDLEEPTPKKKQKKVKNSTKGKTKKTPKKKEGSLLKKFMGMIRK